MTAATNTAPPREAAPPSRAKAPPVSFALHPVHAILLAFPIALFTGAVAADIAYLNTAEMQWSNFAAWLITFALVFGAPVLLWAIVLLVKARNRGIARLYLVLVSVMWVVGLVNAFKHSMDAWSSVEAGGLFLSIVSAGCAIAAGWFAHSQVTPVRTAFPTETSR